MNKCTFTTLAALSFFMLTADANAVLNQDIHHQMQNQLKRDLVDDVWGGTGGGGGGGGVSVTPPKTGNTGSTSSGSTPDTTTSGTTTSVGPSVFLDTAMQTATVSGCPSGTIVSSDGCCCVKD
nr:MAG TPA: hypothetical protein [Caudoviricetes sp.]